MVLPEYLDLRMLGPPPPCPGPRTPVPQRRLEPVRRAQSVPDLLEYHENNRWGMDPYKCKCCWIPHSYSGPRRKPAVSPMSRTGFPCGSTHWNGYPYHRHNVPRNLPPHHEAEVPFTQPGTMSASSCDFDADKILQFNINEVVYRSTRGSGHTSRDLAALHGSNDDGDSFRCDCHTVPTQYPLVNRDPRVRAMRSWGVPGEWEDLCECRGPIPCHLYPQRKASMFSPGGHRLCS